jgi:ribosomal protein S9
MSNTKGGYVRVDPRTKLAIEKVVGVIQAERGGRVSAAGAVWEAIERAFPTVAKEAREAVSDQDNKAAQDESN